MAAITPYTNWVSLTLLQGSQLEDPENLLTGTAAMRYFKVNSLEEMDENRDSIEILIRDAASLYANN